MADERASRIIDRQQAMKSARSQWEIRWENNAKIIWPLWREVQSKMTPGQEKGQYLYDSTAPMAVDNLASGLWSQITNGANRWMGLQHPDEDIDMQRDVRLWLDKATDMMLRAFAANGNRFYAQALPVYKSAPAFGTGVMYTEYRDRQADIHFKFCPIQQCFIDCNQWDEIDTVFRRFEMGAVAAMAAFGDSISPNSAIRRAYEKKDAHAKFDFIHACAPAEHMETDDRQRNLGQDWGSVWVNVTDSEVVREGGYFDFPYQVPRWAHPVYGVYGDSQADLMMPDIRMLNAMSQTTISGAQIAVKPPLLAPEEDAMRGSNRGQQINAAPRAIIYGGVSPEGRPLYQPLVTGGDIGLGLEMEEQRRNAIREGFYFSLMQMVASPSATATEVLAREEEKMRLMGPQLARLQSEFLDPLIDRVFGIMLREGAFGPEEDIPQALLEAPEISVEYVSPLARAQRVAEAGAADRYVNSLGQYAAMTGDPSIFDNLDPDEAARLYSKAYGVDPSIVRAPEQVAAIRDQRVRQQQAAQAAELAPNATGALRDVAAIQQGNA